MTIEHDHSPTDESAGRPSTWVWSLLIVSVVTVLAFIGGWLIGLAPGYTVVLVALLAAVSLAWILVTDRRRSEALSLFGVIGRVALTSAALLIVIQALPIGRDHTNGAITGEPDWSSPRTRQLMVDACYACHSNEVEWPWYSDVAPMSWAVSDHVEEGRDAVNYSEFATNLGEAEESIEEILDGSMPPAYYIRFGLHSEANLSQSERDELIAGLEATPGLSEDGDEREDDEDDDD